MERIGPKTSWVTKLASSGGLSRSVIGKKRPPVLISEGVRSTREAVRAGLGVAVLPDWLIREDLLSGRLVRVLPQWNAKDLPVHVVYLGARLLPTRVRAFIDFAVGYMTKEFGSNA